MEKTKADKILDVVVEVTKTQKEAIQSKQRTFDVTIVRALYCLLCEKYSIYPQEIADKINRDRTTVLYYQKIGKNYLDCIKEFQGMFEQCRKELEKIFSPF